MLWFLIGFIWGVFAAQETELPNVKISARRIYDFVYDIFSEQNIKHEPATRSKSE
tara:strand:+ start:399 stop:563 length:165 start_codon:yes stop_codon:yes gene_type:complete